MKIEHETTWNSLGYGIQGSILRKYPKQANDLMKNPKIKIIINLDG